MEGTRDIITGTNNREVILEGTRDTITGTNNREVILEGTSDIITGNNNLVDTRLLEDIPNKIHVSIVDLDRVSVIGVPLKRLIDHFETHPKSIHGLNKLIEVIGECSEDGDVFIVTQSEILPPHCIKLLGTRDFVIEATSEYDGTRFSIYKDDGRKPLNINYTRSDFVGSLD